MNFSKINDLSIKVKIIIGFAIPVISIIILSVITIIGLKQQQEMEHSIEQADRIQIYSLESRRNEKDFLLRKNLKYYFFEYS